MQRKENDQEIIKKKILFQIMTKKARERLNMVRSVNPKLAQKAEMLILDAAQKRGFQKIEEDEVRKVLQILSEKRKTKIRR